MFRVEEEEEGTQVSSLYTSCCLVVVEVRSRVGLGVNSACTTSGIDHAKKTAATVKEN